jgi:hypothetical protein
MAALHSDEFKRGAVRIALTSGLTRGQVASDLGVGMRPLASGFGLFPRNPRRPHRCRAFARERTASQRKPHTSPWCCQTNANQSLFPARRPDLRPRAGRATLRERRRGTV